MNIANRITFFRLLLIPVIMALIWFYDGEREWIRRLTAGLFILAALSDWVDGYVARRFGQQSQLGAVLDPFADKLLVNLTFIFLAVNEAYAQIVPLWVPIVIMARDSIIIGVSYLLNRFAGPIRALPRILGKAATWAHCIGAGGVLLNVSFAYELLLVMLFFTITSAFDYALFGWEKAVAPRAADAPEPPRE